MNQDPSLLSGSDAAAHLQRRLAHYELALQAAGVGTFEWNLTTNQLTCDARCCKYLNWPVIEGTFTLDQFLETVLWSDRAQVMAMLDCCRLGRAQLTLEFRVQSSTDQIRSLAWDGLPLNHDRIYIGVCRDITHNKWSARNREFLGRLAQETHPLTDPTLVVARTAQALCEHLAVQRCAYAEVDDQSTYVIFGDYAQGVSSIVGRWPIHAFGAVHYQMMRDGQAYIVDDVHQDSRIQSHDMAAFEQAEIRSVICVPLLKDQRLVAAMAVHQSTPRRWTQGDIELVELVVGLCWETLERIGAQRRLSQREQQLRLITDAMPALISFVDKDQRYQFVNKQYEAWFGIKAEDLKERTVRQVVGEEAYLHLQNHIARALSGETVEFETLAAYPTGARHIHASLVPSWHNGEVLGYFSLITDITSRVHAQEQLRLSEERFRVFMNNSPAAAWITDADGRLLYINDTYARMFALPARELIGALPNELYSPEFADQYLRNIRHVSESGVSLQALERAPRPDGSIGQFLVYKFRLPDSNSVGGVAIDISERLAAEEQLREAHRRKDEFLATLAHELRNPLSPIRNGLEIMRLAGEDRSTWERALDMMERQIAHMVHLVDDLLDLSRIALGKIQLRQDRVDIAQIVQHAVETCRHSIEQAGHQLHLVLPPTPLYVYADATRLTQVLANLLNNATKYTEHGGNIYLSAQGVNDHVEVVVKDTGVGIPQEMLSKVFEMFTQIDRHLDRSQGGLGIGLSVVKSLVEMHGGSVVVFSQGMGQGSQFTVRVPLARPQVGETSHAKPSVAEFGGHRVLVVDDNKDAALSLATILRLLGNTTLTAHDGMEALENAAQFKPNLILLDIGMPRMNGYEVATQIRSQPWGRHIVLVALTGWGQAEDRRKSVQSGFNAHMVKPIEINQLKQLLASL